MPQGERAERQDGFTMIELAVVIVLLLLLVIPMAYSIQRSLSTSTEVYRLATAAFLAQQKVEEVRLRASCYTTQIGGLGAGCPPKTAVRMNNLTYNFNQPRVTGNPLEVEFTTCSFPSPFTEFKCEVVYQPRTGAENFVREIQVRVWFDENGNSTWDATETNVIFQTGITFHSPAWAG